MEKLPTDIITDIFSRLPADSVLCAKQVSRNWNRSIKIDIWFTKIHQHNHVYRVDDHEDVHSRCNKKQRLNDGNSRHVGSEGNSTPTANTTTMESFLFLARTSGPSPKRTTTCYGEYFYDGQVDRFMFKTFTGGHDFSNPNPHLSKKHTVPLPRKTMHTLVGSCNGLVCFAVSDSSSFVNGDPIYICNPVTRQEWNLPRYNLIDRTYNYEATKITAGFCYVPSTNQYKVVRICYHKEEFIGDLQVYTLGVDKTWRHKEFIPYFLSNFYKMINATPGVVADRAIHWVDYLKRKILAFDFEDEVVLEVPTPPCLDYQELDENKRKPALVEVKALRGCLSVVHRRPGSSVDIWSLKRTDYCGCEISNRKGCKKNCRNWSWIKEFSIAMEIKELIYIPVPFAFTKNGKILLWHYKSGLFVYDPKTETLKKIADTDHDTSTLVYQVIPHVNTFVSLNV